MSITKNCLVLLPLICLLSGCNKESTYSYLIQHPLELNQEFTDCQTEIVKSPERTTHCDMVNNAVNNMKAIIDQVQQDPQLFGQQVLEKESSCVKTKEELHQAQQTLDTLKQQNAAAADIAAAQQKLNDISQQYAKQHDDVKLMLAVLGLNSPE